ncbi:MAG: hypothetical protein IK081_10655 [Lachnospiraceae bacterium]|nr:hypothetical protein [Lachnospiraceae bacterium]
MKKKAICTTIAALALMLFPMTMLGGCDGKNNEKESNETVFSGEPISSSEEAGSSESESQVESQVESQTESQTDASTETQTEPQTGRKDGERFEEVLMVEGLEETVKYEHAKNEEIGFELDYDYETFVREQKSNREIFRSIYDNSENPEIYLEVKYSSKDADAAAASVSEELSKEYDLTKGSVTLEGAGSCVRIEASNAKDNGGTPDQIQVAYVIPASKGSIIATAHYTFESSEGFGRRFSAILNTLEVIGRKEAAKLSDDQALQAIKNYCYAGNPSLKEIESAGEYPVNWEITSSSAQEIVVLYAAYTGAQIRYYIDPVTGETYVTEFVSGITAEEERTSESFNVRDYLSE